MKCKSCLRQNNEKRKYCSQCGKLLTPVCPVCNFINEEGDIFCGGCGKNLTQKTQDSPAQEEQPDNPQGSTGTMKIDPSKFTNLFDKHPVAKAAEDAKAIEQHLSADPAPQPGETTEKTKLTQDEVDGLFEDSTGKKKVQQESTPDEVGPDGPEVQLRYVDKNSPSMLNGPVTQEELDKLIREYQK